MGILETIQKELKELKREQKALRTMLEAKKAGEVSPEWMNVADTAKRYQVSRVTIEAWLLQMREWGYAVTTAQVSKRSPRMIHVEQFDRAFMELFADAEGGAA